MSQMPMRTQAALTEEQESLISEILSQYDTENLSASDAASIIEAFDEAGIRPGQALEEALAAEGVDARELGDIGGVGGRRPPPPPPPQGEDEEGIQTLEAKSIMDYLEELLEEQEDISEMTEEGKQAMYNQLLDHFGLVAGESLINIQV